jgi:hypothetical protein
VTGETMVPCLLEFEAMKCEGVPPLIFESVIQFGVLKFLNF